jgi:hypothetical protein
MHLTEDTFLVFAMNSYTNAHCLSVVEFEEDVKRFLYLRKLFLRYKRDNDLKERLILNHIIILFNVFGNNALRMLFYKIDKDCWEALITFLLYLHRMPHEFAEYNITLETVVIDERITEALRKL